MHFERRNPDKETRSAELFHLLVLAKNVAHILAQETFNALAKLLHPVHVLLEHFPVGAGSGFERRNFLVDAVIPGNIGDQIFDHGERLHRLNCDGLVEGKGIHTSLAGEPRSAVDLGRAGAALTGFAIPAHRQIGCLVGLDIVEGIQYHHARGNRDAVGGGLPTFTGSPEDLKDCFRHCASAICVSVLWLASRSPRRGRDALGTAGETPALRRSVISHLRGAASNHLAFPALGTGTAPYRFPCGLSHCSYLPRWRRARDDQSGCGLRGFPGEPGRCAPPPRKPSTSPSSPGRGASRD